MKDVTTMAKTADRAKQKAAIRDTMMALEVAELGFAEDQHTRFLEDAMLDERDNPDKEDIAESRINSDQAAALENPVHVHESKIDALENMDFSVTDTAGLGAVVKVNGTHYVIAVSTTKFECDGVTYMGISEGSPIVKAMDGLKKGEKFELNGKTLTLQDVF
jgi:hypothetical protein